MDDFEKLDEHCRLELGISAEQFLREEIADQDELARSERRRQEALDHLLSWLVECVCHLMLADETPPTRQVIDTPYLNAEEAAAYLRITLKGLYQLVHRGTLRRSGGTRKYRFTREMLDNFLRAKKGA